MTEKNEGAVRTVQRALTVLECFDFENRELSFTDIVQRIDLPKSTVSRLISTLELEGFLERDIDTSKFKLGHRVYLLGLIAGETMDIRNISVPYMDKMTKLTGETTNLYILENYDRVCIAQVESPMPIKQLVKVGERFPIWAGATGRSILAQLDEDTWHEMIKELRQFTDKTVVNPDDFINNLKEIRKSGYALSLGEKYNEVGCIAAPIFNYSGVMGCISISGPVYRFPEDISNFAKLVTESAIDISHKLGFKEKRTVFLE